MAVRTQDWCATALVALRVSPEGKDAPALPPLGSAASCRGARTGRHSARRGQDPMAVNSADISIVAKLQNVSQTA
jgi:hypothetical protein